MLYADIDVVRGNLLDLLEQTAQPKFRSQNGWDQLERLDRFLHGKISEYDLVIDAVPKGVGSTNALRRAIERRLSSLPEGGLALEMLGNEGSLGFTTVKGGRLRAGSNSYEAMLCYRRGGPGEDIARDAFDILTNEVGCKVFWDQMEGRSGENYNSSLYGMARSAKNLIVICTPDISSCEFCHGEIAHAVAKGRTAIPVTTTGDACEIQALPWLSLVGTSYWSGFGNVQFWKQVVLSFDREVSLLLRMKALSYLVDSLSDEERDAMLSKLNWFELGSRARRKGIRSAEIMRFVNQQPGRIHELTVALGPKV